MEQGKIIQPIAYIHTDFEEKFGIPRQSGRSPSSRGEIIFEKPFRSPEALRGITGFSHLWLIFDFSKAHTEEFSPTVRPPRLGGNRRVGVFACRSPFRPNSLGLSCVKLEEVKHTSSNGDVLVVSGADLLDGTPIYDVKPYLPSADCIEGATGGFAEAFTSYRLQVEYAVQVPLPQEKLSALTECLAEDPRPSYIDDPDRIYGMKFAGIDVKFKVVKDLLTVISAQKE